MPWTDRRGPTPERSERELLALVKARAGTIRRRRRVSVSTAAVSSVAVLILAVVALVGRNVDSGRPTALRVTGPPGSVTSVAGPVTSDGGGDGGGGGTVLPEPATTSTTAAGSAGSAEWAGSGVVGSPSSLPPPAASVRTTLAPAAGGSVTSVAVGSAPVTTVSPSTSTTSTTAAPLPTCSPSEVVVTASTDKASYAAGEVVKVDVAAQNRSGHACAPVDPGANFQDPAGKGLGGVAVADMFTMPAPGEPPPRWDPGQTLATSFNWTPACPPTNSPASCAPGTYTVTASFGSLRSAPTAFKLV